MRIAMIGSATSDLCPAHALPSSAMTLSAWQVWRQDREAAAGRDADRRVRPGQAGRRHRRGEAAVVQHEALRRRGQRRCRSCANHASSTFATSSIPRKCAAVDPVSRESA